MAQIYLAVYGQKAQWVTLKTPLDKDKTRETISGYYPYSVLYWLDHYEDEGITTGFVLGKPRFRLIEIGEPQISTVESTKTKVEQIIEFVNKREDLRKRVKFGGITVRELAEITGQSVATTGRAMKEMRKGR